MNTVFDVCKAHMWISRCWDVIFTAIKTKKEETGSESNCQASPPQQLRDSSPHHGRAERERGSPLGALSTGLSGACASMSNVQEND
jgi:hypothetical protein